MFLLSFVALAFRVAFASSFLSLLPGVAPLPLLVSESHPDGLVLPLLVCEFSLLLPAAFEVFQLPVFPALIPNRFMTRLLAWYATACTILDS